MSAFLVEKITLDKILTEVTRQVGASRWLREKFQTELGIDYADSDWQTRLGQKLWELNQLALGYRYGDAKTTLHYRFSQTPEMPVQALKALQCWLYQCAEGDIPEQSKFYRFFDTTVKAFFAEEIVRRLPEYDEAEWG